MTEPTLYRPSVHRPLCFDIAADAAKLWLIAVLLIAVL